MTPEDRKLLIENNEILRSLRRTHKWAILWGLVKFAVIVVPLVIGYLYLEPYLGPLGDSLKQAQSLLGNFK